jgi:mitogen-activated protein kinase 1/3
MPFERRLSDHVTSRGYRAPEVVLLEKHYYKAVDVWSAGVVLADLFKYASRDEISTITGGLKIKSSFHVFSSQRCFPLSPKNVKFEEDNLP